MPDVHLVSADGSVHVHTIVNNCFSGWFVS
jgi:hypothetical protein